MIKDGLYHFELGLPEDNVLPASGWFTLEYSGHAQRASLTDRYGTIELPERVAFRTCKVIEVEYLNGRLIKLVLRTAYTETLDLVFAVKPNGFVKTVWLNVASDLHKTLDASRYNVVTK